MTKETKIRAIGNSASGDWTPRRTYTWVRRDGDPRELCSGLARSDA